MAPEGIATLPQAPGAPIPSFDEALEGSKQAVSQQIPDSSPVYEQGIEQLIQQLNLAPEELNVLKQILELLLKDERRYPELRQRLINEGGVRPEDIPEEFDRGYLTTMLIVVQEAIKRNSGAAQGAQMPVPQGFERGGLADAAESLRQKGRNGDTILAHINPQEAAFLKSLGGSGTINPATGLPEFFIGGVFKAIGNAFKSVGNAVKSIVSSPVGKILATVALTMALGPAGFAIAGTSGFAALAIPAALAATSVSLAGGSNLKQALIAGATSGAMAGFAPQISSMLPGSGGFLNAAATGAIMGASYGAATGQNIAQSALTGGVLAGGASYAGGASATGPGPGGGSIFGEPREPAPILDKSQGIGELADRIAPNVVAPESNVPASPTNTLSNTGFTGSDGVSEGTVTLKPPSTQFTGPDGVSEGISRLGPNDPSPNYRTDFSQSTGGPKPSPSGPMDYLAKTKDYLFSSDPKNPGFFYNDKGNISIPAVTGTVLAGGALMGGFNENQPGAPGIIDKNVTGQTLVNQDPNKYVVQGLPGYNAPAQPPYTTNVVPTLMYGQPRPPTYNPYQPVRYAADGGISNIYPRKTGKINGPGTGTSDSIPAMLSDGEFVLTAKAVRGAGKGSRREGAKKLYRMMHALEKKVGGNV